MPNLKCGVSPCNFWNNNYCTRSIIQVRGNHALEEYNTKCSSYRLKRNSSNEDDFNIEIGLLGYKERLVSVNCDAVNCKFNRNLLCKAKILKINGTRAESDDSTFCSTFTLK